MRNICIVNYKSEVEKVNYINICKEFEICYIFNIVKLSILEILYFENFFVIVKNIYRVKSIKDNFFV